MLLLSCIYLLPVWFIAFVYIYIYLIFYLFFVFFLFFHILFSLFLVVTICHLDLLHNFSYLGNSIFFLGLSTWIYLFGFVFLVLSTWICLESMCLLYNMKIYSSSSRPRIPAVAVRKMWKLLSQHSVIWIDTL